MSEWYEDEPCDCPVCRPSQDDIKMLREQLSLAVKKGAYLLDEQNPGWREKIGLSQLSLSSGCSCVLGQLYGTYFRGLEALDMMEGGGSELGFDFPLTDCGHLPANTVWSVLDQLWCSQIVNN